jgi:hypothetical protein
VWFVGSKRPVQRGLKAQGADSAGLRFKRFKQGKKTGEGPAVADLGRERERDFRTCAAGGEENARCALSFVTFCSRVRMEHHSKMPNVDISAITLPPALRAKLIKSGFKMSADFNGITPSELSKGRRVLARFASFVVPCAAPESCITHMQCFCCVTTSSCTCL